MAQTLYTLSWRLHYAPCPVLDQSGRARTIVLPSLAPRAPSSEEMKPMTLPAAVARLQAIWVAR